ncbi:MAG: septum formation initiator family protein [Bacteroidota bacterium]
MNKYTLTILAFMVWVTMLDGKYSWVKQYKLVRQLHKMEESKQDYMAKLLDARETYEDLMSNKEKFAREKYFIRKKGEDIYIIK